MGIKLPCRALGGGRTHDSLPSSLADMGGHLLAGFDTGQVISLISTVYGVERCSFGPDRPTSSDFREACFVEDQQPIQVKTADDESQLIKKRKHFTLLLALYFFIRPISGKTSFLLLNSEHDNQWIHYT